MHFNGRNEAIKFVDDYGSMILEDKIKAAEGEPEPEPSKAKRKAAKPDPSKAKAKRKKSPLEREEFINEIKK